MATIHVYKRDSTTRWRHFNSSFVAWSGPLAVLYADPDRGFKGELIGTATRLGADAHKTPPEASWQQGHLHGQFGIFKYMDYKTVEASHVLGRNASQIAVAEFSHA